MISEALTSYCSAIGIKCEQPSVVLALVPELEPALFADQVQSEMTILSLAEYLADFGDDHRNDWVYGNAQHEMDPQWVAMGSGAERLLNLGTITGFDSSSPLGIASLESGIAILQGDSGWDLLVRWVEEAANVPYRHWRKYETMDSESGRQNVSFRFVLNEGIKLDTSRDRVLGIQGLSVWKGQVEGADVYIVPLTEFQSVFINYLSNNPQHFLVDMTGASEAKQSPVLRLDHIGVVSKYEDAIRDILPLLGARLAYEGPVDAIGVQCEYHELANIDIEIVSPTREDSVVSSHRAKLPFHPLHHLAFEVESLEAGVKYFREHGYHPIDGKVMYAPKPYHRVIFLSPMQTRGLLIELVADGGSKLEAFSGGRKE